MDEAHEYREMTPRGKVSERLRRLWKESRTTEPDENEISNALDQTSTNERIRDRNTQSWFAAAKALLNP
jgi:hypothetical protein